LQTDSRKENISCGSRPGRTIANRPPSISGGDASRIFEVDGSKTNVTLSGLTTTQGDGPGGTLPGSGGAVLINGSTLTITSSTLSGNQPPDSCLLEPSGRSGLAAQASSHRGGPAPALDPRARIDVAYIVAQAIN
jgi:hypothetical protein